MEEILNKVAIVKDVTPSRHIPNKTNEHNINSTLIVTDSRFVKLEQANFNLLTAKQLPKKIIQSIIGKNTNEIL